MEGGSWTDEESRIFCPQIMLFSDAHLKPAEVSPSLRGSQLFSKLSI